MGVDELNNYWEGPAKLTYCARAAQDAEFFDSVVAEILMLIEDMDYARAEYDRCEDDVRGIVASVRV